MEDQKVGSWYSTWEIVVQSRRSFFGLIISRKQLATSCFLFWYWIFERAIKNTLDCSMYIQMLRRLTASEVSALWPNSISRPRSALGNTGLSSYKCELLKSSVDHQERWRRKQMSKRKYYSPGESRLGEEFQDQVRTVREPTPDWSSNQEREHNQ